MLSSQDLFGSTNFRRWLVSLSFCEPQLYLIIFSLFGSICSPPSLFEHLYFFYVALICPAFLHFVLFCSPPLLPVLHPHLPLLPLLLQQHGEDLSLDGLELVFKLKKRAQRCQVGCICKPELLLAERTILVHHLHSMHLLYISHQCLTNFICGRGKKL